MLAAKLNYNMYTTLFRFFFKGFSPLKSCKKTLLNIFRNKSLNISERKVTQDLLDCWTLFASLMTLTAVLYDGEKYKVWSEVGYLWF